MKILVVGSRGFIGSHCHQYFLSRGHEVTGCDVTGNEEASYIKINPNGNSFDRIFEKKHFDLCINAAGSAHVDYSFTYPEKDFELNVSLVINILAAIKKFSPGCKLINFSSAAVYGNPEYLPIPELAATHPLSPYGYHKKVSEDLLHEYSKLFNLSTCSLRVFSAYGEGLRKQLFWDMYQKAISGLPVKLFGTGSESRDFIYIADLVEVVALVLKGAPFKGEVYNVANGEEVTIRDAAESFYSELDPSVNFTFSGEEKVGDPKNWLADITKIQRLGYARKFTFAEGINRYCKWLKELK